MKQHTIYSTKKLRLGLLYMHKLRYLNFPRSLIKQVYYAICHSHLLFGITCVGLANRTTLQPLFRLHRNMIKVLLGKTSWDDSMCNEAHILLITCLHTYRLPCMYYFHDKYRTIARRDTELGFNEQTHYTVSRSRTFYGDKKINFCDSKNYK